MQFAAAERVPVKFESESGGEGELSWGQQAVWKGMVESGVSLTMTAVRQLAPGARLEEFVDEFSFYLSRYQAMRTLLRYEPDGRVLQVVHASGTADIEVYDAGDRDPAELAAEVGKHYTAKVFDYANEWPMRWAVVRQRGALTHAVVALAHHVADPTSAMAMFDDLRDRDAVTGVPPRPPGLQPLEQAQLQQTPAARRQNEAALRYWEDQLRVIPPTMFPVALAPSAVRHWQAEYLSPALYLALRDVAARLGVNTGAVLYAAFASALSSVTGVSPIATTITVNTRIRPGFADAAGPMAQLGLCTLDVADAGFDELVHRARRRLFAAQKHAYYAPYEGDALIERVGRERGLTFNLRCMFNDRRGEDGPLGTVTDPSTLLGALPATTIEWEEMTGLHQMFMIHVNHHSAALAARVQVDTARLSRADLVTMLQRMESSVVDAALQHRAR